MVQFVKEQANVLFSRGWVDNDEAPVSHNFFSPYIFSDSIIIFPNSHGLAKKKIRLLDEMQNDPSYMLNTFSSRKVVSSFLSHEVFDWFFRPLQYLFMRALKRRIALRGAVAYGETIINKSKRIFLGKPILDAHNLEKAQEWLGIAIHPSCHKKIESLNTEIIPIWFSECSPKLKDNYNQEVKYVLNWAQNEQKEIYPETLTILKEMQKNSEDNRIIYKYENTITYVEWLIKQQNTNP